MPIRDPKTDEPLYPIVRGVGGKLKTFNVPAHEVKPWDPSWHDLPKNPNRKPGK